MVSVLLLLKTPVKIKNKISKQSFYETLSHLLSTAEDHLSLCKVLSKSLHVNSKAIASSWVDCKKHYLSVFIVGLEQGCAHTGHPGRG